MPLSEAKRLCPRAIILEGHAQVYRCYAERLFDRCRELSPDVETYLDEAYLELTGTERVHGDSLHATADLKRAILDDTGLTVTCGIGPNRMLAKLTGKTRKLSTGWRGFTPTRPRRSRGPARRATGRRGATRTRRRFGGMNIRTIGELRVLPVGTLEALFGAPGRLLSRALPRP
jgi:DNA polymerase-4